jgi:V-type H+-transporting ATPase subunit A
MDTIFDGIQRPLTDIARLSGDCFIPRGVDIASLDTAKRWQFTPGNFREGDPISGGDFIGSVSFLLFA